MKREWETVIFFSSSCLNWHFDSWGRSDSISITMQHNCVKWAKMSAPFQFTRCVVLCDWQRRGENGESIKKMRNFVFKWEMKNMGWQPIFVRYLLVRLQTTKEIWVGCIKTSDFNDSLQSYTFIYFCQGQFWLGRVLLVFLCSYLLPKMWCIFLM